MPGGKPGLFLPDPPVTIPSGCWQQWVRILDTDKLTVSIKPAASLSPFSIKIPGDFSSAAFILAAGVLVEDGEVLIRDVGINPTRTGLLDVSKGDGSFDNTGK